MYYEEKIIDGALVYRTGPNGSWYPKAPKNETLALALAVKFHDVYERLAPRFGYETRPDTKKFNPDTPNGKLMIAVCAELLNTGLL